MVTRRQFAMIATGSAIAAVASQAFGAGKAARPMETDKDPVSAECAAIEARVGGRLGVAILDTASGRQTGWRMHERFPMCSTFKFLLASAVLARKDQGKEDLGRKIAFSKDVVVSNSPATAPRAGSDGMTVAELCEAAITLSDNTAANLLLVSIGGEKGGPAALTKFARSIGDTITRLDRNEPTLNEALDGDLRDTTTPAAMLADLRTLLLGKQLTAASRDQLMDWLVANKTGDARLRAGLPREWRVGDKTGTGERGTANDIAIVWRGDRAPLLVTTYLTGAVNATSAQRDAALAQVGALAGAL